MTQAKHTPGPWAVVTEEYSAPSGSRVNWHWVGPQDWSTRVCRVVEYSDEVEMQQANARLIAAAPTMLEALQDCREALRRTGHDGELAIVDAAIDKATGAK